jgi:hypothetical protein
MSYNEVMWWQAYKSIVPSKVDLHEIGIARIITGFSGGNVTDNVVEWLDPARDPEILAQQDAELVRELEEESRETQAKQRKD